MKSRTALTALTVLTVLTASAVAVEAQDPGQLSVERIVASREFAPDFLPPTRWLDDSTYTIVQSRQDGKGADLVAVNAPRGGSSVIVSAEMLVPSGASEPLDLEGYEWSADHNRLLIFTNSARVWRANTRGDYWVLDLKTKQLRKLGGSAAGPPSLRSCFVLRSRTQ